MNVGESSMAVIQGSFTTCHGVPLFASLLTYLNHTQLINVLQVADICNLHSRLQ